MALKRLAHCGAFGILAGGGTGHDLLVRNITRYTVNGPRPFVADAGRPVSSRNVSRTSCRKINTPFRMKFPERKQKSPPPFGSGPDLRGSLGDSDPAERRRCDNVPTVSKKGPPEMGYGRAGSWSAGINQQRVNERRAGWFQSPGGLAIGLGIAIGHA